MSIEAASGVEVLATYGHPYFDRSPEHYSSHVQTPVDRRTAEPFVVTRGHTAYIANPVFRSYAQDGYGIYKQVVAALIRRLLPSPVLTAKNLPSTAQVTLLEQSAGGGKRYIVHLLHYPITRRAPNLDIVEEPALVKDAMVDIKTSVRPRRVTLPLQSKDLPARYSNGYAGFTVPFVDGHQIVVVEL